MSAARPIRVLLIAPPLEVIGGQSIQAAKLLEAFSRRTDIEVRFLRSPPQAWWLSPLQRIKFVRTVANATVFQLILLRWIGWADVVHTFTPSYWAFLWTPAPSLAVAKLFGRASALHYHDGRAEGHLRDWRSSKPLIRLASETVVPSGYLADVFERYGLETTVIVNTIAPEEFLHRERATVRPIFLHNRGLEALYNVGCTLRAFAIVQQHYPDASMVVSHDGPSRQELEQLATELGLRNVRFTGHATQQEMRALYDEADIYWMSPDFDNMPGSVLEAYASGVPVVSSDAGGVRYILRDGETGLLFPKGNHEAMARAALRLIEEPSLALRLARNARAELEKYEADAVAAEWAALYRRITGRGDAPSIMPE